MQAQWGSGVREPSLKELLEDPILHLLLKVDGLDESRFRAYLEAGRARLQKSSCRLDSAVA